jgi:hypothetical protein
VSTAAQLRTSFFEENLRDLNRLVFAAEALETPKLPDVPDWDKSPANAETFESEDPEELRKLALEWQEWASKLDDILRGLSLDDLENEIAGLRAKAKAARAALIRLDAYDPPVPGSP